jgi:formylglycine-generating enzyme
MGAGLVACGLAITGVGDGSSSSPPPGSVEGEGGPGTERDGGRVHEGGVDGSVGGRCEDARGAKMVSVNGKFCIDAIETTNAEYRPFFLAALAGDAGVVPRQCAWNSSYLPGTWTSSAPYFREDDARLPVRPVDWCDAWMFCQWSGKRLCGSVDGRSMGLADAPDASVNAWSYACSAAGTKAYPYGSAYIATACNTDEPTGVPVPAGTYPACVGGYPGIFDMSGNAWEWDDSCSPGNETAECSLRGGSVTRPAELDSCATALRSVRTDAVGNNGIRCCKYD